MNKVEAKTIFVRDFQYANDKRIDSARVYRLDKADDVTVDESTISREELLSLINTDNIILYSIPIL